MTQAIGAEKLGLSLRQFQRTIHAYKATGDAGLVHGLKGKSSNHARDIAHEEQIGGIIIDPKYNGFGPTLLCEDLEKMNMKVSDERLRKLMIRKGLREDKKQKETKYRQRRPRKRGYGEMIQYDGSYHHWLEKRLDEEFCLLVGIDDATGRLMLLRLGDNEGYQSTVEYWIYYMRKYGVPECIYVDKFATYKVNHKKATDDTKLVTKFEKALQKLGCLLIKANSPQAKGRVERANRTLQDRLVKAMRLANINDVASANEWMNDEFIPKFNKRLGKIAQREGDKHRPLTQEENDDLMRIFATESTRVVANDFVITYQNRTFQLLPEGRGSVRQKSSILVLETIHGEIQFIANKKPIPYSEIDPEKVKQGRAKAYLLAKAKKEKEDKERIEANTIKRAEERHRISKQKQAKGRAEKIIKKAKKSRQE